MVDNRGISPIPSFNFKSGDASGMANKMSDEKMGQGGEYFAQELQEEEYREEKNIYHDRSAQLRASLDSLASVNAGAMMIKKITEEKEEKRQKKGKPETQDKNDTDEETVLED